MAFRHFFPVLAFDRLCHGFEAAHRHLMTHALSTAKSFSDKIYVPTLWGYSNAEMEDEHTRI
jgi:hypothetical protein